MYNNPPEGDRSELGDLLLSRASAVPQLNLASAHALASALAHAHASALALASAPASASRPASRPALGPNVPQVLPRSTLELKVRQSW